MMDAPFVAARIHKREFDLIVSYHGEPMQGPFDEWPAQMQDAILEAKEKKERQISRSLTIDRAGSDKDYEQEGVSFVHVVAVVFEGVH